MTKRDKVLLLSSIVLSLCVIGTAVLVWDNLYIGVIIAVAVLSVFAVYMIKIRKGKFEKLLSEDFYKDYQTAKDAVIQSQLPAGIKKSIKEDILDLMLTAQETGRNPESVIGNPEVFAKNIIKSYASLKQLTLLHLFDGAIAYILFAIGIQFFEWLENIHESFFVVETNLMIVVFILFLVVLVMPLTKILTATKNPWMFFVPLGFGVAFVLLSELLRRFFYNTPVIKTLLDSQVVMVPNAYVLAVMVVAVPVLAVMKNKSRKKIVHRYLNEQED